MRIGRWTFGAWAGVGWEWGRGFEYWTRYLLGPFYALHTHSEAHVARRAAELDAMFPDEDDA